MIGIGKGFRMICAVLLVVTCAGFGADVEHRMKVGKKERTYLVHVPPGMQEAQGLFPLVVVLHEAGGTAENMAKMTEFSQKADEKGFIVVYPNGVKGSDHRQTWNAGNCCGEAFKKKIDDIGFLRVLLEKLQVELPVDPKRIYVVGMSNGGMLAHMVACGFSEKIAAMASVAGAKNVESCPLAQPVSVILFHGTDDEYVPYFGGRPKKQGHLRRRDRPVKFAVSSWVKRNQCVLVPQKQDKGNIVTERYGGGQRGTEVVLVTIKGGRHAWPGAKEKTRWGDVPTQEISATDVIWEFFASHPKP